MDGMIFVKDDTEAANEYFDIYMTLRQALREGKIETTDVEDYLAYKERLLTKKAKQLVQNMLAGVE